MPEVLVRYLLAPSQEEHEQKAQGSLPKVPVLESAA